MSKPIILGKNIQIDSNVVFGNNVVIYDNVIIGKNTKIRNNVVICEKTKIGDNCLIYDNAVLGRVPKANINIKRSLSSKFTPLEIGSDCIIGVNVVLYIGSTIENCVLIGDLVSIREECYIGMGSVIGRGSMLNYNIKIGKNVRIMDLAQFGGDMIVEDFVFISPQVSSANDNYMGILKNIERKGAIIKKFAHIGTNSTLLANIEIGEYSIIGAGSLVNKDIPPYKIAYGVPVKIIKDIPENLLNSIKSK